MSVLLVVVLLSALTIGGCSIGKMEGIDKVHREAVSMGHAHYRISNTTNGSTKFTWNPPCGATNK